VHSVLEPGRRFDTSFKLHDVQVVIQERRGYRARRQHVKISLIMKKELKYVIFAVQRRVDAYSAKVTDLLQGLWCALSARARTATGKAAIGGISISLGHGRGWRWG
jgi:hypothetical protein